jgi:hypothetical protein
MVELQFDTTKDFSLLFPDYKNRRVKDTIYIIDRLMKTRNTLNSLIWRNQKDFDLLKMILKITNYTLIIGVCRLPYINVTLYTHKYFCVCPSVVSCVCVSIYILFVKESSRPKT